MLRRIKSVFREHFLQAARRTVAAWSRRQQAIEQRWQCSGELRLGAGGERELLNVGPFARREIARLAAQARGQRLLIKAGGQQGGRAGEQSSDRAVFVDGKIVDHRVHGKRQRVLQLAFGGEHDLLQFFLTFAFSLRRKNKTHAAAGHAAEHPEAPEVIAKGGSCARDQLFGIKTRDPRDDRLQRAEKVIRQRGAERADVSGGKQTKNMIQRGDSLAPRLPFSFAPQQIFLRDHFKNRSDVLRHAAVHEDERVL